MYREMSAPFSPDVMEEMKQSVDFLKRYEKRNALIAGGALWSWAANERARDVDIFVSGGFFFERKLNKDNLSSSGGEEFKITKNKVFSDYFGPRTEAVTRHAHTIRYHTLLPKGTVVDLVVTKGVTPLGIVTEWFDYEHCKVAFGKNTCIITGGDSYEKGVEVSNSLTPRKEIRVRKSLWGNPQARRRIITVMETLKELYDERQCERKTIRRAAERAPSAA